MQTSSMLWYNSTNQKDKTKNQNKDVKPKTILMLSNSSKETTCFACIKTNKKNR